jgi:hypothetical protein
MSTPSSRSPSGPEPQPTTETELPRLRGIALPYRSVDPPRSERAGQEPSGLGRLVPSFVRLGHESVRPGGGSQEDEPEDRLVPAIRVQVHGPNGARIPMLGVVDSGADWSLFPLRIANSLGLRRFRDLKLELNDTAGGRSLQYVWRTGLEIEVRDVGNRRILVRASFANALPARMILLGRQDFFSHFRVTVDQREGFIGLEPYEQ